MISAAASAQQLVVGSSLSMTGPAASLGIPEGNTFKILPKEIAGVTVNWIVLDDGTDTTKGVANIRKLATDEKADLIIGPTTTPVSLAAVETVSELKIPMISLGGSQKITDPVDEKRRWVFKTPQSDSLMAAAIVRHLAKAGVKKAAFIGFNDAYGDGWFAEFTEGFKARGIEMVAAERYTRNDTSVTGQALKIAAANPDAVVIGASGTPAALPAKALRERGYKGKLYVGHGAANNDFIRVGGKDVEGIFMPSGPILVADQLPDSALTKKPGIEYGKKYDAVYGEGTANAFGGYVYDAFLILQKAIPSALKTAKPGTPEFRSALRDAIEQVKEVAGTHAVYNMTATDHTGQDERARVMVTVKDGKWKLVE
ncbi:ABC transporter substrate-binding protein [Bradyrhizobium sp. LjRoot220]|uniref:ABC transporter substrate-binding protein n=1 Tax=Bradyrhizobium sp. LjRoot220 TaxID=3342284 RepID=UPI003ECEA37F